MSFEPISTAKASVKGKGKSYEDCFDGYVKALASPKYRSKTKIAQLEMDCTKHSIEEIKNQNTGKSFWVSSIPALYKDGEKGTKKVVCINYDKASNTLAFMKSYRE